MTDRRMVWKGALLFGAFGPGVALLLTLLMVAVFGVVNGETGLFRNMGLVLFIGVPAAYLIGTLPAAATGAIAGALRQRLGDRALIAVTTVVGAAISASGSLITDDAVGGVWFLVTVGACSALIMTLQFIRWTRPRAPNAPSPT